MSDAGDLVQRLRDMARTTDGRRYATRVQLASARLLREAAVAIEQLETQLAAVSVVPPEETATTSETEGVRNIAHSALEDAFGPDNVSCDDDYLPFRIGVCFPSGRIVDVVVSEMWPAVSVVPVPDEPRTLTDTDRAIGAFYDRCAAEGRDAGD